MEDRHCKATAIFEGSLLKCRLYAGHEAQGMRHSARLVVEWKDEGDE